ncbi:MAG: hypothetical protein AAF846_07265 [Chloroflexota bacterium]
MTHFHRAIREIEEKLGLTSLKQLAKVAGVQTVFRIVSYYADNRAHHSVATIICGRHEKPSLEVQYLEFLDNQTIHHTIEQKALEQFMTIIHRVRFDTLTYPIEQLSHSQTIWSLQRAVGRFTHEVMINPHRQDKPYRYLINGIDGYLSDAVREITV